VNKQRVHRRSLSYLSEHEQIKCEFKKEGLICPKPATVYLYGKEICGYYCEQHAQIMEERYD